MQLTTTRSHRWEGGYIIPCLRRRAIQGDLSSPSPLDLTFFKKLSDFGASVNIMPKVIYDQINGDTLLYTTMHFQLADQSLCYPKGVREDVIVRVGQSYVPVDFVVLETGGDIRAPIILG